MEEDALLPREGFEGAEEPSTSWQAIVGTCQEMCPSAERLNREHLHELSPLETFPQEHQGAARGDPARVVKKYRRPTAGAPVPLPSDIRTPEALQRTMEHLCALLDTTAVPLTEVCSFIRDRTRSVRQDITQQCLRNGLILSLYENIARFHILCGYLLSQEERSIFDPHQNLEQLYSVLQTLETLYTENPQTSSYEGEFHSYYLLSHLITNEGSHLYIQAHLFPEIAFSLSVVRLYQQDNFVGFFKQLQTQATYLQACLLSQFHPDIRRRALGIYARGYNHHPVKASFLCEALSIPLEKLLDHTGSQISSNGDVFLTAETLAGLPAVKVSPEAWIDTKRTGSLSRIMAGTCSPRKPRQIPVPISENGGKGFEQVLHLVGDYVAQQICRSAGQTLAANIFATRKARQLLAVKVFCRLQQIVKLRREKHQAVISVPAKVPLPAPISLGIVPLLSCCDLQVSKCLTHLGLKPLPTTIEQHPQLWVTFLGTVRKTTLCFTHLLFFCPADVPDCLVAELLALLSAKQPVVIIVAKRPTELLSSPSSLRRIVSKLALLSLYDPPEEVSRKIWQLFIQSKTFSPLPGTPSVCAHGVILESLWTYTLEPLKQIFRPMFEVLDSPEALSLFQKHLNVLVGFLHTAFLRQGHPAHANFTLSFSLDATSTLSQLFEELASSPSPLLNWPDKDLQADLCFFSIQSQVDIEVFYARCSKDYFITCP